MAISRASTVARSSFFKVHLRKSKRCGSQVVVPVLARALAWAEGAPRPTKTPTTHRRCRREQ
eukprot:11169476-Lingulodinium_polyedra.AAC.1